MKLFKNYTYSWWQIGLIKISVLCFGIAVGATWPWIFFDYSIVLYGIAIILACYLAYVALTQ